MQELVPQWLRLQMVLYGWSLARWGWDWKSGLLYKWNPDKVLIGCSQHSDLLLWIWSWGQVFGQSIRRPACGVSHVFSENELQVIFGDCGKEVAHRALTLNLAAAFGYWQAEKYETKRIQSLCDLSLLKRKPKLCCEQICTYLWTQVCEVESTNNIQGIEDFSSNVFLCVGAK